MVRRGRKWGTGARLFAAGMVFGFAAIVAYSAPAVAGPGFKLLKIDGSHVKWGAPILGTAARTSYALVDRTISFHDARNCGRMGPVAPVLAAARMSPAEFESELAAAFAMWEAAAAITFRRVVDPAEADILIGAQAEIVRWSWAMADVALDKGQEGPVRNVERGLICINPERPWHRGAATGDGIGGLRYALAHEIGHTIGLDHPGATGALMAFRFDVRAPGLLAGDIGGAIALYGVRTPPPMAVLGAGTAVSRIP